MRPRRVLRRIGLALAGTVAAILLLVAVALGLLGTEWGGGIVRDLAVPRINRVIAGRLELASFRFAGRSLELRGVVLRDPENQTVLQLRRLSVAFSPLALLRGRVDLKEIVLEQPALA